MTDFKKLKEDVYRLRQNGHKVPVDHMINKFIDKIIEIDEMLAEVVVKKLNKLEKQLKEFEKSDYKDGGQ